MNCGSFELQAMMVLCSTGSRFCERSTRDQPKGGVVNEVHLR